MATISLNDAGKAVGESVQFSLGAEHFELDGNGTYETEDRGVIGDALVHPWLTVEVQTDTSAEDEAAQRAKEAAESDDPFINPKKDHLRADADPEVVKAAQEEADRLRRVAAGEEDPQPSDSVLSGGVVPATPQTPVSPPPSPATQSPSKPAVGATTSTDDNGSKN